VRSTRPPSPRRATTSTDGRHPRPARPHPAAPSTDAGEAWARRRPTSRLAA
jgi:hypothetical protein